MQLDYKVSGSKARKATEENMPDYPDWRLKGDWFDNCSCAVACPCTFGQAPDNNVCQFVLFWHIREGHFRDIKLNDLCIARVGIFEGNLWEFDASGRAGHIVDDRADDAQVGALLKIFSGKVGGWPEVFGKCFAHGKESLGIERAAFSYEIAPDLSVWGFHIPGKIKAWAKSLSGPTSNPGEPPRMTSAPGSEVGPGGIFTWGKSIACKVEAFGLEYSWTISSSKHSPFEWTGQN